LTQCSSQIIFYIFCRVPLKDSIIHQGICDVLVSLLDGVPDHDSREKIVFAMLSLYNTCEPVLHNTLSNLQKYICSYIYGLKDMTRQEIRDINHIYNKQLIYNSSFSYFTDNCCINGGHTYMTHRLSNHISGVMVSVLTSSVVDHHGIEPRPG
jgi:hypothetical protein